jgi:CRISPR/Cas system-associated exonuclease Cas4 (RecB family)
MQSEEGKPIELQIFYLATGEQRVVPEQPRYEPKRVEKYNNALHGIQQGEFPVNPSEEHCPVCPFLFICPA